MYSRPLSIIIPTKNEEENIHRLLNSIDASEDVEIIVVDNFSTDKTREISTSFNVKFFEQGDERSNQRNYGASKALGEYLLFLDADMELQKGLLEEILQTIKQEENLIGFINERVPGRNLYAKCADLEKRIYADNLIVSSSRLIRKDIFSEVKGFDPKKHAGEDMDLQNRLKKFNLRNVFFKKVIYHHEGNLGFKGVLRKKLKYAKVIDQASLQEEYFHPIKRFLILFSKWGLILKYPHLFLILLGFKVVEYGIGRWVKRSVI